MLRCCDKPRSDGSPDCVKLAGAYVAIFDVAIFEFGSENNEPIDEINMGSSVYSTPVAANDRLYISTKDKLFSIGEKKE